MSHKKLVQSQRKKKSTPAYTKTSPPHNTSQGQQHFNLAELFCFLNKLLQLNYCNTEQQT